MSSLHWLLAALETKRETLCDTDWTESDDLQFYERIEDLEFFEAVDELERIIR